MIKIIDQALESPPTSAGGTHHQKRLNLGTIVNSQQEDEGSWQWVPPFLILNIGPVPQAVRTTSAGGRCELQRAALSCLLWP